MSTDETGGRARRRGRTREAILQQALALMAEGGVEAIALRELARRMDYSPAALYRYFASREEIISTLAAESMALLSEHLRATLVPGKADPLVLVGLGYLTFAREQPARFRLLFTDLPSIRSSLDDLAAGQSAYAIVLDLVRTAISTGQIQSHLDAESVAYTLWALVHGMAVLESTHLRRFDAQFDRVHKQALEQLVRSWQAPQSARGRR